MKLEEAIEILSDYVYDEKPCPIGLYDEATKLGIEALKRRKYQSEQTSKWADMPLPGETTE